MQRQGSGDLSPTLTLDDGRELQRLPELHSRRYVSVFAVLTIPRTVYGTRETQEIEAVPLDARLHLSESTSS